MIATLAWKEYREQRGLWLAIACLAALLALTIGLLAKGGLTGANNDRFIHDTVIGLLFSLMVAQGIVCGAQLLAGEKEPGTLAFLDTLSSLRSPLWSTKLIVGILFTVAQALVLFGIMMFLQMASWEHLFFLFMVGLLTFMCGMAGGALCEKVFPAIVTAMALGVGWLIFILPIAREAAPIILAVGALVISKKAFSNTDRSRRLQHEPRPAGRFKRGFRGWQTLLWLSAKQGRWVILLGLGLSFLAGTPLFLTQIDLNPIATLVIGLVCGLAVFAPEQAGEQDRFLGAQRCPPGQVWLVKTIFWMLMAAGMATLYWVTAHLKRDLIHSHGYRLFEGFFSMNMNPGLYLTLWTIYGFCFGQFSSLLSRKIVVAGVLSAGTSLIVLLFWLPSLILGGVQAWQILAIPLIMLGATRLSMWFWYSGSLYTRRHFLVLCGCALVTFLWMGGVFWHRAMEIPDVGEPFDLKAFEVKLNRASKSEAGPLIRQGMRALVRQKDEIVAKWGWPTKFIFEDHLREHIDRNDYLGVYRLVLKFGEGWPAEDNEIGPWLDALFAGDWVKNLRAAAKMPLGLVVDPRQVEWNFGENEINDYRKSMGISEDLGVLFSVRALQLQARGDNQAALDTLETCLGLSRQIRNYAGGPGFYHSLFYTAISVEKEALHGFDAWFYKIGPRPELLRKALIILQEHEKEIPDPLDAIKTNYYVTRRNLPFLFGYWYGPSPEVNLFDRALESPWEKERYLRFFRAMYQGELRLAKLTPAEWLDSPRLKKARLMEGQFRFGWRGWRGLLLADGGWTPEQWGRLLSETFIFRPYIWAHDFPPNLRYLRARQVLLALTLYQTEEGHAAAKLDDLIPRYLSTLPLDPCNNQHFPYKLSQGEEIEGHFPTGEDPHTEKLVSGQGLLWVEPAPMGFSFDNDEGYTWYFPVPLWHKK